MHGKILAIDLLVWYKDAFQLDFLPKVIGIVAEWTLQKVTRWFGEFEQAKFVVPRVFIAAWRLNRLNRIVCAHFIRTNGACISRCMNFFGLFNGMMIWTKRLKCVAELKSAVFVDGAPKMKRFFALRFATANVRTAFLAKATKLYKKNKNKSLEFDVEHSPNLNSDCYLQKKLSNCYYFYQSKHMIDYIPTHLHA